MDESKLKDQIAFASGADLEKIRARMEVEQARRDQQRAERERKQARLQIWQVGAAIATIVAVIASAIVIFQGFQNLKQQQAAAVAQDQESRYSSIFGLNLDVQKTLTDHPEILCSFWARLCHDHPSLAQPKQTAKEKLQARVLASYKLDFYQYLYAQLQNLHAAPEPAEFILLKDATQAEKENYGDWITWSETIVNGFLDSPIMCEALIDSADAYGQDFVHAIAITNACSELADPWA